MRGFVVVAVEEVPRCYSAVDPVVSSGGETQQPDQGAVHLGEGATQEPAQPRAVAGGGASRDARRPENHRADAHG